MRSMKPPGIAMWVIYHDPADYPGQFVARRWEVAGGGPKATREMRLADSLEGVRALLPGMDSGRLYRIGRNAADDPVIVETWL